MHQILTNRRKRFEQTEQSVENEQRFLDEKHLQGYENEQLLPLIVKLADSSRKSKRLTSFNASNIYQDVIGVSNRFDYNASIPGTSQDVLF